MKEVVFWITIIIAPLFMARLLDIIIFKKISKNEQQNDAYQVVTYVLTLLIIAIYRNNF